jgi:hypothetical protein
MDGATYVHLAAMIFGAGAVYGAIRADLRSLHARVRRIERIVGIDDTGGLDHGNAQA